MRNGWYRIEIGLGMLKGEGGYGDELQGEDEGEAKIYLCHCTNLLINKMNK